MIHQHARHVANLLLAALVCLVAMAPARAAIWSGVWDPQYGSPFTAGDGFTYDLGWGGRVKVNDDACAGPFVGDISNDSNCGGGAFVVPGTLTVSLYEHPNTTPIYNTLTFDATSLTIVDLRYNSAGKLIGFSTVSESNYEYDSPSLNVPNGAGTNASFAIQFVLDGSPCLFCGGDPFASLPTDYSGPVLFAGISDDGCDGDCFYRNSTDPANRPNIQFTPEPASLALIAGGLFAAGLGARRRRATLGSARSV